jgi:hypothetical protein
MQVQAEAETRTIETRHAQAQAQSTMMKLKIELAALDLLSTYSPDARALAEAARANLMRRLIGRIGNDDKPTDDAPSHPERVSVQMVVRDLVGLGVMRTPTTTVMANIGKHVAAKFEGEQGNGRVVRDKKAGGLIVKRLGLEDTVIEEVDLQIAKTCRIQHSEAHGFSEVHAANLYDVWTYPATYKATMAVEIKAFIAPQPKTPNQQRRLAFVRSTCPK